MKLLDYNTFINQDRQKVQSVNEHLWSGIIHRSETGEVRKEAYAFTCFTKEEIQQKIQEIINKTHPKKGDTIDLNHLDVSKVTDMSKLFYDYDNYINFTDYNFNVSKWNVSKVENMSCMFYKCEKFNCDLSNWNVSNVKDMSCMFYYCKNFNGDLSRWNVSRVTNMEAMFYNCRNFSGDLSKWDVSNVEVMEEMFWSCKTFNCDLSKWDVSRVMYKDSMFLYCFSLEIIPDWYPIRQFSTP